MALILSRTAGHLKNRNRSIVSLYNNVSKANVSSWSAGKVNVWATTAGLVGAGAIGFVYTLHQSSVHAGATSDVMQHPAQYPWSHVGILKSFDHASIRRGYEVYKQVCAACHSLRFLRYRELVNVCLTEEEARAEAEAIQVQDGPGDDGKMYMRSGKLTDSFQSPYANDILARAANNGALPPDLSYIILGRHDGENYVFSLLTGYQEKPAGFHLEEGQNFNPFFPDGALSMAQSLFNEAAEYSDGTPATASQMAKDVVTFLSWVAQPEHDTRKKYLTNALIVFGTIGLALWYWKRHIALSMKSRKIFFRSKDLKK